MKYAIMMCLFGFSFGAPHPKNESIIPTENGNVDGLIAVGLMDIEPKQAFEKELREESPKVHIGKLLEMGIEVETIHSIASGETLSQEYVEIISDRIIGFQVKEALKLIKHEDIEKPIVKGFVKEVFKEALSRLGVENLVKRILAGENVESLFGEAISSEEVEMILNEHIKGLAKKINKEVINQGFITGFKETSPVIGPEFYYRLLLDNGIAETRIGSEGPNGTSIMHGSYTIPLGRGDVAIFNWVADENGYRVESPHLPTPPPAPPHVAELLRIAEEQRAAGISFDE